MNEQKMKKENPKRGLAVRSSGSWVNWFALESHFCYFVAVCPWANHLASLSLPCLIYKMGLTVTSYLTAWF